MLILVKLALKRISFIIISLVITVFITGNYFIYKQVTKAHKREFKAYIRTNFAKTEVIEISPSELFCNNQRITWLDENKEILLGEIMYDIVSIKNNGTKVLLTVVNDSEEKALMNEYSDEFNGFYNQNNAKSKNNIMKDFFGFKYLLNTYQEIQFEYCSYCYVVKHITNFPVVILPVHLRPPVKV